VDGILGGIPAWQCSIIPEEGREERRLISRVTTIKKRKLREKRSAHRNEQENETSSSV